MRESPMTFGMMGLASENRWTEAKPQMDVFQAKQPCSCSVYSASTNRSDPFKNKSREFRVRSSSENPAGTSPERDHANSSLFVAVDKLTPHAGHRAE